MDEAGRGNLLLARQLARISHQLSAAAAEKAVSTALRSVTVLDVLSSTPARANHRAPLSTAFSPRPRYDTWCRNAG